MSYPKNTSSPRALRAKVTKRADGTPITSGVVAYHHHGTARVAAAGVAAVHVGNGTWSYTPTQAETNYDEFGIELYHPDAVCEGPQITVMTTTEDVFKQDIVDAIGKMEIRPTINRLGKCIGHAKSFNKPIVGPVKSFNKPIVEPVKYFDKPIVEPVKSFDKPIVKPVKSFNKPIR